MTATTRSVDDAIPRCIPATSNSFSTALCQK